MLNPMEITCLVCKMRIDERGMSDHMTWHLNNDGNRSEVYWRVRISQEIVGTAQSALIEKTYRKRGVHPKFVDGLMDASQIAHVGLA